MAGQSSPPVLVVTDRWQAAPCVLLISRRPPRPHTCPLAVTGTRRSPRPPMGYGHCFSGASSAGWLPLQRKGAGPTARVGSRSRSNYAKTHLPPAGTLKIAANGCEKSWVERAGVGGFEGRDRVDNNENLTLFASSGESEAATGHRNTCRLRPQANTSFLDKHRQEKEKAKAGFGVRNTNTIRWIVFFLPAVRWTWRLAGGWVEGGG